LDCRQNITGTFLLEQGTLENRRQLFEELLWEHRSLSEAHSKCQGEFSFSGIFSYRLLFVMHIHKFFV
jgi:hypothetical protein